MYTQRVMHINNKSWQFVKGFYSILIIVLFIHITAFLAMLVIGGVFSFFLSFLKKTFFTFLHSFMLCENHGSKISMIIIWMTIPCLHHCILCTLQKFSLLLAFAFQNRFTIFLTFYFMYIANLSQFVSFVACSMYDNEANKSDYSYSKMQNVFATLHAICIILSYSHYTILHSIHCLWIPFAVDHHRSLSFLVGQLSVILLILHAWSFNLWEFVSPIYYARLQKGSPINCIVDHIFVNNKISFIIFKIFWFSKFCIQASFFAFKKKNLSIEQMRIIMSLIYMSMQVCKLRKKNLWTRNLTKKIQKYGR